MMRPVALRTGSLGHSRAEVHALAHERGVNMTRWVALFEDNPEAEVGWIRKQHAEEHFRYLAEHRSPLRTSGAEHGNSITRSMIVFDRARAQC
jgi:hypothetical protein